MQIRTPKADAETPQSSAGFLIYSGRVIFKWKTMWLGIVVHISNPSAQEMEEDRWKIHSQRCMEGIMQWLKHRRRSPWILERTVSSYRIYLYWHLCQKNLALRTVLFNLCNVCFNFKFWRAMLFFSTDNYRIDLSLNQSTWAQIWLHEVAVEGWSHGTLPPQPYPSFLEF